MTYLNQSTYSGNTPRRRPQVSASSQQIRAELHGSDTCTAEGHTARGHAPVLALCRRLVDAGIDPGRPLHAYRGDTLCLTIDSIGKAARLEVNSKGTGFIKRRLAVRTATPIAPHKPAGVISIHEAQIGSAQPQDQRTRRDAARRRNRERKRLALKRADPIYRARELAANANRMRIRRAQRRRCNAQRRHVLAEARAT